MKAMLAIIGGIVLIVAIVVGAYAIKYYTADVRGRVNANEKIKSGDSRIAGYDHFFNLCAAIQADEGQLDALEVELNTATGDDISRIQANIAGVSAQRLDSIFSYNADARKGYTIGQFRSSQLPFQLSSSSYSKDQKTNCVAQ